MQIDVTILEYPNLTVKQFCDNGKKFLSDLDDSTSKKYRYLISELIAQQIDKTLSCFSNDFDPPSFPRGLNSTIKELNQATEESAAEVDQALSRVVTSYITLIRETFKSKSIAAVAPAELKPILETIISEDGKEFAQFFDYFYTPMFYKISQDPTFISMFQNAVGSIVYNKMLS